MPETNGSGRLDRIEANLERVTERLDRTSERLDRTSERLDRLSERFDAMVEHHDAEFKRLMTWQVLMQDEVRTLAEEEKAYRREQRERDAESRQMQREWETEYRKMLRERDEVLNGRIDKLVSAIGELIQHLPRTQA